MPGSRVAWRRKGQATGAKPVGAGESGYATRKSSPPLPSAAPLAGTA